MVFCISRTYCPFPPFLGQHPHPSRVRSLMLRGMSIASIGRRLRSGSRPGKESSPPSAGWVGRWHEGELGGMLQSTRPAGLPAPSLEGCGE